MAIFAESWVRSCGDVCGVVAMCVASWQCMLCCGHVCGVVVTRGVVAMCGVVATCGVVAIGGVVAMRGLVDVRSGESSENHASYAYAYLCNCVSCEEFENNDEWVLFFHGMPVVW